MLFGTIRFAESDSADAIAKKVAAAESASKPTADIFTGVYWITDLQECRWFAYMYFSDSVSFSPGDFVAFDTGNTGDVLRGATNKTGLAQAPFAFNLQAATRVPLIEHGRIKGWNNMLTADVSPELAALLAKVLPTLSY